LERSAEIRLPAREVMTSVVRTTVNESEIKPRGRNPSVLSS